MDYNFIKALLITILPFAFMLTIDKCIKREERIILTEEEIEEAMNLLFLIERLE